MMVTPVVRRISNSAMDLSAPGEFGSRATQSMSRSSNTASTSSTTAGLKNAPAQNRAELPRLVVAQLYRRGLVSTGVEAVDNAAPAVMDDDGDAAAVGSRHLVAATDFRQIIDDEVETAVGLHALALLYNRQSSTMRLGRQRVPIDVPRIELTLSAQSATSSRSVARIHATSKASATTR